jgi:hypothetical protein
LGDVIVVVRESEEADERRAVTGDASPAGDRGKGVDGKEGDGEM